MIIPKENRRVIYENLFKGVWQIKIDWRLWKYLDVSCYRGCPRCEEGLQRA